MDELNALDIVKSAISASTGVPVDKLTGTTEEEIEAQALVLQALNGSTPPTVPDNGENIDWSNRDTRTAEEQFADWLNKRTAFNPYMNNGWIRL